MIFKIIGYLLIGGWGKDVFCDSGGGGEKRIYSLLFYEGIKFWILEILL